MNKRTTKQAKLTADHATPLLTKSAQNVTTKQCGMSYRSCNVRKTTYHSTIGNMHQPCEPSRTTISVREATYHTTMPTSPQHDTTPRKPSHTESQHKMQPYKTTEQRNKPTKLHTHTHTHTRTTHHSITHQVTTQPHRTCMPTINRAKPPQQNAPHHKTPSTLTQRHAKQGLIMLMLYSYALIYGLCCDVLRCVRVVLCLVLCVVLRAVLRVVLCDDVDCSVSLVYVVLQGSL